MTPIDVKSNIQVSDSFRCPIACCVGKKKRRHHKPIEKKVGIIETVDKVAQHKIVHVKYDSETGKTIRE